MLRCSSAALSKNAVAAAIARPARTRCQRGHRERENGVVWRVFLLLAHGGARELIFEKTSTYIRAPVPSTAAVRNVLGYSQYKKRQIQAPGATFSNFGDEVEMEGGHGNCCRFATLTGVRQGAHICLAKLWVNGKVRS